MDEKDHEICLCFHVPLIKLESYIRNHRPKVCSQLSNCHGAGSGCGWCVPHLEKIFEQMELGEEPRLEMSPEEYRRRRQEYKKDKKPMLPPSPDTEHPLELDLNELLDQVPDDMKLDE